MMEPNFTFSTCMLAPLLYVIVKLSNVATPDGEMVVLVVPVNDPPPDEISVSKTKSRSVRILLPPAS